MANAQRAPSRRRLNVPPEDVSTLQWLDAQDNASISIRLLIHAQIERDGMVDLLTRTVRQLPRRGRPPASVIQQARAGTGEPTVAVQADSQPEPEPQSQQDQEQEPLQQPVVREAAPEPAPATPAPASEPETASTPVDEPETMDLSQI